MTYSLEPSEHLRSPEYWDGIDIDDSSMFRKQPAKFEGITHQQVTRVQDALFQCAVDMDNDHYQEISIPASRPAADSNEKYPDGSVVVLDSEQLWLLEGGSYLLPGHPSAKIEDPFVPYWKREQGSGFFGQEVAIFPDRVQFYVRALSWGVLLSNPSKSEQLVKFWRFSDLSLTQSGPRLEVGAPDDTRYHQATRADFYDRTSQPELTYLSSSAAKKTCTRRASRNSRPPSEPPQAFARTITRLRGAKIIEHANGQLPDVPDISAFIDLRTPQHA